MPARRLTDLYVTGKKVLINDGQIDPDTGAHYEPIEVWLSKLVPAEHTLAMKKANAEKSKVLSLVRQPERDQEYFDSFKADLFDMDRDQLINIIVSEEAAQKWQSIESELSHEEEWEKDGYLEGLKQAWDEGLREKVAEDPDDEEAKRVKEELQRFADEATKIFEGEHKVLARAWEDKSDSALIEEATKKQIENQADLTWLKEYRMCELWLSVRDPENHNIRYFETREEIEHLSLEVRGTLLDEYRSISIDLVEGKELPAEATFSDSSTPPESPETEPSSGLKVVEA